MKTSCGTNADYRFSRTEQLLGPDSMEKLEKSRVALFGLGAVGSYALEALARAGIGNLLVVDCDIIRITNVNRQLLALESTLGRKKAEVARERVLDINPDCNIHAQQVFVDANSIQGLIGGQIDVVVDAIDGVGPKVELLYACAQSGIHTVSSMGAACRTDPFQVKVADVSETMNCPLARFVRKKLRKRGVTSGIRCVFSLEDVPDEQFPVGVAPEPEFFSRGRDRAPIGSLSYMTGIFGLIIAQEVMKALLDFVAKDNRMSS